MRINTTDDKAGGPEEGRRGGNAFLLAQLGAEAAARWARRITPLDLTPAQTGLLRLIAWQPGQSQQALARKLGTPPSRLVLLLDELEERGLTERRRNPSDRRNHALYLTDDGSRLMARLGEIGAAHEEDMCAPLSTAERAQLHSLLTRIAAHHELTPGAHPGYRAGGPAPSQE